MDTFAARYFGSLSASVREKMESGLQVFIQLLHQIHGWTAQTTQANWLKKQFPISSWALEKEAWCFASKPFSSRRTA